jgi:hypothetical protein
MPSKTSEYLPKLISPSDDPGEKPRNKLSCLPCKNIKTIITPEGSQVPCPYCSPSPDYFRQLAVL